MGWVGLQETRIFFLMWPRHQINVECAGSVPQTRSSDVGLLPFDSLILTNIDAILCDCTLWSAMIRLTSKIK